MAGCLVKSLCFLVLVALVLGARDGAGKRKAKEEVSMEDYLEGQNAKVEQPSRNASPLELCILLATLTCLYSGE